MQWSRCRKYFYIYNCLWSLIYLPWCTENIFTLTVNRSLFAMIKVRKIFLLCLWSSVEVYLPFAENVFTLTECSNVFLKCSNIFLKCSNVWQDCSNGLCRKANALLKVVNAFKKRSNVLWTVSERSFHSNGNAFGTFSQNGSHLFKCDLLREKEH